MSLEYAPSSEPLHISGVKVKGSLPWFSGFGFPGSILANARPNSSRRPEVIMLGETRAWHHKRNLIHNVETGVRSHGCRKEIEQCLDTGGGLFLSECLEKIGLGRIFYGLWFGVQGLGFRVQGLGFRV